MSKSNLEYFISLCFRGLVRQIPIDISIDQQIFAEIPIFKTIAI